MKAKKKIGWIVLEAVLVILLIVVYVANFIALPYSDLIAQFLGQETTRIESLDGGEVGSTTRFTSSFSSYNDVINAEIALSHDVQTEGAVLLKNTFLPMAPSGSITLLGTDVADGNFILGGGGSGAIDTSSTPNLMQVFTDAGYQVNPTMWEYYNVGAGRGTRTANQIGEQPISSMTQAAIDSVAQYNDAAIIAIGRVGSEGADLVKSTTEDPERHMLELSQNELDLLAFATEHFDNVVVLLNTSNAMELGPLEDMNVSVVWIGSAGQQGLGAIPEVLNGTRYPSGRLADTYAYDALSAPANINQDNFAFTNVDLPMRGTYYVYAEGIYIGYKYYETRYADVVMGQGNAGDYDYASTVQYPFGFGLGYTTFETSNFSVTDNGSSFTVTATVTNTGSASGKEVVQIYMQSPYTQYDIDNGIEKSAVELVGFAKTGELAAGASENVTIEIPKELMRSYDAKGAGTYIVDAGDYYFATGSDAHDALNNILAAQGYTTADGMTADGNADLVYTTNVASLDTATYATSASTGNTITNQFVNADIAHYDPDFVYLSRHDWTGTWPQPYGGEEKTMAATPEMLTDLQPVFFNDPNATMPITGAESDLTLASLFGADYDDPRWDELLNKMTPDEMMALVSDGGFGTPMAASVNKPATTDKDGPAGISSSLIGGTSSFGYPIEVLFGASWNTDLTAQMGSFIGEDALLTGISGWYAPAVNTHRTPFSGRNFEYYSEDGLLSGKLAASLVSKAQEMGVVCYMKHFALNDQETNRNSASTFSNEQAIREVYLEPFEIAVREGGLRSMMSSYNGIGLTWSAHHRGLLTEVLRGEWGFQGTVITDYTSSYTDTRNAIDAMHAGNDMYLNSAAGAFYINGVANDASAMTDMRNAVHNILFVYANSNAMNGISEATRIVAITPAWQYWMYTADAVLTILIIVVSIFIIRKIMKPEAAGEANVPMSQKKKIIIAVVLMVILAVLIFAGVSVWQWWMSIQF